MREKANEIASHIDNRGFAADDNINLGDRLTELSEMYQKGTIFYKKYTKGKIPREAELQEDLSKMMDIYQEYAEGEIKKTSAASGGNGRYKLVAVRPDWSDSSDLFGHTNLNGELF